METKKQRLKKYTKKQILLTKRIIKSIFPILFIDFDVNIIYRTGKEYKIHQETKKKKENILIQYPVILEQDFEDQKVPFVYDRRVRVRKNIQDLFFLIHEYSHGIYNRLIKQIEKNLPKAKTPYNSFFTTLSESFAISLEAYAREIIIRKGSEYGFSKSDRNEVKRFEKLKMKKFKKTPISKKDRRFSEKDDFLIFYKILKDNTEEEIYYFIKNLDIKKAGSIPITNKKGIIENNYIKVLKMSGKRIVKEFKNE